MCGIAGILDLKAQRDIDRDALQRMTDALAHRGPDGEGFFYEPGIGLGHRRLAIIDVDGGKQPFTTAKGGHVLAFNGEIYNFPDLRRMLEQSGSSLTTRSDTEALAELWAKHDTKALALLAGMFAFAIWDKSAARLTLVRDRLGEKPLYYGTTDDGFLVFASELKGVLASGKFAKEICPEALCDYFAYGYVPDPKSIFKTIHKLPAAHMLSFQRGMGKLVPPAPYWQLSFKPDSHKTYQAAQDELKALLGQSVSSQMISDVPLGAFLSGGIDSGTIVASMAATSDEPVKTCTIGFAEKSHDERALARLVAAQYKTEHHEKEVPLAAHALIDKIAGVYDEPFADSSALPTYLVCKLAKQHVTVALSGDGGDEVLAGYRRYPFFQREERVKSFLPRAIRQPLFRAAGAAYPKLDWAPRPLRLKTSLQSLADDAATGYGRSVCAILPDRLDAMLSPNAALGLQNYNPAQTISALFNEADTDHPLLLAQYADLKTWLSGRMLVKTDRAAMASSLEMRAPLLDHRLVEWAATLPPSFKLEGQNGKRVLKDVAAPLLPAQIINAPKRGFGLPMAQWLRAHENNPLDRLKKSPLWHEQGFLDRTQILRMIDAHQSTRSDYAQELWSVIMFDAFLQQAT